jgi:lysophospholipase L1-like esterase
MAVAKGADAFKPSRREFVYAGVAASAAGIAAMSWMSKVVAAGTESVGKRHESLIKPGDTILFQGDSITDAGRKRDISKPNSDAALGHGYAWLTAAQLLINMPNAGLKIYNRGNSGNKVYQLAERWQADCLDLKPNVLSILVGVNDFWHTLDGTYKGTLETYEKDYRALVKRTKDALPNVKLVICEPFVLRAGKVNEKWFPAYDAYREAAKRVAEEAAAVFLPFQSMFDAASKIAPAASWAKDGVHPTPDGATMMAGAWLSAVEA